MLKKIENIILSQKLIEKDDNVLIALSGGPDSVFLFHILLKLKDRLSFKLYASHINHLYRGCDAEHDEKFVTDLCNEYGVKLFIKRKNATEYAQELGLTEEEAGRKLRYDFFNDNITELGGGKIAVAHNLNDQSETVLQRLIRGTGIDGLSAMSFKNGSIIRPILEINKKDIIEYLEENKISYCMDYTNNLPIYGRNKIRLNLIPYLEENFNPNIQNVLFRMSRIMKSDSEIVEKYINIIYNDVLVEIDSSKVVLNINKLKILSANELGRVVRKAIKELKGNTINLENKHIDYVISLIFNNNTGKQINLSDNIIVLISYNNLIIRKSIEKIRNFEYNINIGKEIYIKEVNKTIVLNLEDATEYKKKANEFFIDFNSIKGQIKVRNRKNSDTMIPFGMTGKKKLKDIFINYKIPVDERPKMLILEDEEKIIWLESFRISDECKVSGNTKNIITIKVVEG